MCLAKVWWQVPVPDGILTFRCKGVCKRQAAIHLALSSARTPGHAALRIKKGQMSQTNNALGEVLLVLTGAVLDKGRISAGASHSVQLPRSILCMHICLPAVTSYRCRYICVPRQVFSDLFCNKDTGECFILCSTVKDVCSCKIVLGHPSRKGWLSTKGK